MRVLVLGVSGMLGNAMIRVLSESGRQDVFGTARSASILRFFTPDIRERVITGVDIENQDSVVRVFAQVKPQVVVNCIGLVKQLATASDPLVALPVNALLPHRLSRLCKVGNARLVHVSTDCVFSGSKGNYLESDKSDAEDLYGKSKFLGEVTDAHAITVRTSIIGHALAGSHGLIDWFLSQEGRVPGYTNAIFSGLPTVELAHVIRDLIIPNAQLSGLYHVASAPIAKFDLLQIVRQVYGKTTEIVPDDTVVIDRSLNADRFRKATGYVAPKWLELTKKMHQFR